jgi:hypothetical protein
MLINRRTGWGKKLQKHVLLFPKSGFNHKHHYFCMGLKPFNLQKTYTIMHIESLKTVLLRDIADLQDISSVIEPGCTLSKIEVQILQSRVRNLAAEIGELLERISTGEISVNGNLSSDKAHQTPQSSSAKEIVPSEKVVTASPIQHVDNEIKKPTEPEKPTFKEEPAHPVEKVESLKTAPAKTVEPDMEETPKIIKTPKAEEPLLETKPTPQAQQPVKPLLPKDEIPKASPTRQSPTKPEIATKPKTESDPTSGRKTLADQFSDSTVSVNERVGQTGQAVDRASMLSRKPVTDIHKAIKLNDRIGFIRELFSGDSQKYTQTIDALNNFSDFNQALEFINQNFSWDQNSENFKTLIEIVYRRYMQ